MIGRSISRVGSGLSRAGSSLSREVSRAGSSIGSEASRTVSNVGSGFDSVGRFIGRNSSTIGGAIGGFAMGGPVGAVMGAAGGHFGGTAGAIGGAVAGPVIGGASGIGSMVGSGIGGVGGGVAQGLAGIGSSAWGGIRAAGGALGSGFGNLGGSMGNLGGSMVQGLGGLFGGGQGGQQAPGMTPGIAPGDITASGSGFQGFLPGAQGAMGSSAQQAVSGFQPSVLGGDFGAGDPWAGQGGMASLAGSQGASGGGGLAGMFGGGSSGGFMDTLGNLNRQIGEAVGTDGDGNWLVDNLLPGLMEGGMEMYSARRERKDMKRMMRQSALAADPFMERRAKFGEELSELMEDPDRISESAAYQFRKEQTLEAVDRRMAAGGNRLSGRRMGALADHASGLAAQEYDAQWQRLAQMSGATTGQPAAAGQAIQQGGLSASQARQRGYAGLGYGLSSALPRFSQRG